METTISKIIVVDDLGTTPARVNRKTGELYVNKKLWSTLPKEHRFFILLHEAAHAFLKTKDEHLADAWAFKQYAEAGYPLSEAIKALTRVLTFSNEDHYLRTLDVLQHAIDYDQQRGFLPWNNELDDEEDEDIFSDFSKKWRSRLRKVGGGFLAGGGALLTATGIGAALGGQMIAAGAGLISQDAAINKADREKKKTETKEKQVAAEVAVASQTEVLKSDDVKKEELKQSEIADAESKKKMIIYGVVFLIIVSLVTYFLTKKK